MWRVTWKSITSHKLRLLTTSLSIALGVAFIAGALMLGATMTRTFDDLFSSAFKNTDVVLRGASNLADENDDLRPSFDESVLATVQDIPGVGSASADVNGFAQLVDPAGRPVKTGGAPQYGAVWAQHADLSPWNIAKGSAPAKPDEIVIDAGVAKRAKLIPGDRVTVLTEIGPNPFVISGTAKFGSVDSPAGAQFVLFENVAVAQQMIGTPGKIDQIYIRATKGVSQQKLVDRIKPLVGSGVDVATGKAVEKQSQDSVDSILRIFTLILSIFGGIALFVAAFIINNTFSIILAQRTKEMALLRAIGATRRQVLRSVMLEAFVTGLFASLVGLFLGILVSIALQAFLMAIGIELPTSGLIIPSNAVMTSLVAGTLITVVAAFLPARRSSKIPPIAALREVAIDDSSRSLVRFVVGLGLMGVGVVLLAVGLVADVKKPYIPVGFGAALVFIGVYFLGPVIARPASRIIGWPLPRLKGQAGVLARENAMRNPRRTSSTAAALMIGVSLVTLASVFFTSAKASAKQVVGRSFGGDFIVSSSNQTGQTGVPFPFVDQLRKRSEIGVVGELQHPLAKVDGGSTSLSAVNPSEFDKIMDIQVKQGDLNSVADADIAVSQKFADAHHLDLGAAISLELQSGISQRRIVAIYKDRSVVGNFVISLNSLKPGDGMGYDAMVLVNTASGVTTAAARKTLDAVAAPFFTIKVQDETQLKKEMTKQIDGVLSLFLVLLGLAVIIALIGIANTLALSVFERTHELGLLRAVGMTRRQMRSMVRWESVIVALLGTMLGLIIGVAFGWALVTATKSEGMEVLAIPWLRIVIILLVAAVAGVFAAILPARRAARIDVLAAISSN